MKKHSKHHPPSEHRPSALFSFLCNSANQKQTTNEPKSPRTASKTPHKDAHEHRLLARLHQGTAIERQTRRRRLMVCRGGQIILSNVFSELKSSGELKSSTNPPHIKAAHKTDSPCCNNARLYKRYTIHLWRKQTMNSANEITMQS